MIEVYLFHVMFAVQILVLSILVPRRLLQRIRQQLAHSPPSQSLEAVHRTMVRYRIANMIMVAVGLIVMAVLFRYMQRADWDDGPVEAAMAPYFVLQCLPFAVLALFEARVLKMLRSALAEEKRRAVLQRRGLFDFVSPFVIVLTMLCYLFYVALVFYIQRDPFKGFAGPYINIAFMTALYAVYAFVAYRVLYSGKRNPLQTHEQRMVEIGTTVRALVYTCLGTAVFLMTNFSLAQLDRQRLEPLAMIIYFVGMALWVYGNTPKCAPPVNGVESGAAH